MDEWAGQESLVCAVLAAVVVLRGGIAPEAKQIPSPWHSRNESAFKVAFDPSRLKNFNLQIE